MPEPTPLPAYTGAVARCPKCGSAAGAATYWEASWAAGGAYDRRDSEEHEHLRRQCLRCGFEWNEAPVDAEAEEKADG